MVCVTEPCPAESTGQRRDKPLPAERLTPLIRRLEVTEAPLWLRCCTLSYRDPVLPPLGAYAKNVTGVTFQLPSSFKLIRPREVPFTLLLSILGAKIEPKILEKKQARICGLLRHEDHQPRSFDVMCHKFSGILQNSAIIRSTIDPDPVDAK